MSLLTDEQASALATQVVASSSVVDITDELKTLRSQIAAVDRELVLWNRNATDAQAQVAALDARKAALQAEYAALFAPLQLAVKAILTAPL
jgi:hypothetical protein